MKRSLDVYLNGEIVGQLTQDDGGQMLFSYVSSWLERTDGYALSCSLPLQKEVFKQKACRGFFAGILPEEESRDLIARILGISARNDYAMLEHIGGECAGAVTFQPLGVPLPKQGHDYRAIDDQDLRRLLGRLPAHPLLCDEEGVRLSLAGVQNKIAVHVTPTGEMSIPLNGAPSTHIIKPAIDRFPNLVKNEALCLELAALLGIPTAQATAQFAGDTEYLLIQRYDRVNPPGTSVPIRLHQEDFCQALGIPPERKYQGEGGPTLANCFSLLREVSRMPAVDLQNLLAVVIFNVIIGNHDAHGKNFSLLYHLDQSIRLAPAYDLLSTVYYPNLSTKMAMKLGKAQNSDGIRREEIEVFADHCQLSRAGAQRRFIEIAQQVREHLPQLKEKYCEVEDLIALIDERAARLLDIL